MIGNRFNSGMSIDEVYSEIHNQIGFYKNEDLELNVNELKLDLRNACVHTGGGESLILSARAEAMLSSRLDIGSIRKQLSPELYSAVEAEINENLKKNGKDRLVIKHRDGVAQAVVSDRYAEIPYEQAVNVLHDLRVRPIRVVTNDALLRVQAVYDKGEFDIITPDDGEPVSMGVQMVTSDTGAASLQFDVYTYRWICSNGMIMGKNSLYKFRKIHVTDRGRTSAEVNKEVRRVLQLAKQDIEQRTNSLIRKKINRQAVVKFLAEQPFGKKALAMLAERVIVARNMYDVVNILTEEGHNPNHSISLQNVFETAAGELMMLAA